MLSAPWTLLKSNFALYKGYIYAAIIAALVVTFSIMYLRINLLQADNKSLTLTVSSLNRSIATYSSLLEAQADEANKELNRAKFEKEVNKSVNKLKSEGKDRPIGPIMSNTINLLSIRQREQTSGSNTK